MCTLRLIRGLAPAAMAAALSLGLATLAGCARPHAAESNLRLTEAEQRQRMVLDDEQLREVRAILTQLAEQHEPDQLPGAAVAGVRWSDVEAAAFYACGDMEMAIERTIRGEGWIHFVLRTADERPATLNVKRVDDHRVYVATATCGRFHDDHARADDLVRAFDRRMRRFGAKRGFE